MSVVNFNFFATFQVIFDFLHSSRPYSENEGSPWCTYKEWSSFDYCPGKTVLFFNKSWMIIFKIYN